MRKYGQKKDQIQVRSIQSPIPPCPVSGSLDSHGLLWFHHSDFAACNPSSLSFALILLLILAFIERYLFQYITCLASSKSWGLYHSPVFTFTPMASPNDFSGPYGLSGPSSPSDSSIATHCFASVTFQTMEERSMIFLFLHLLGSQIQNHVGEKHC